MKEKILNFIDKYYWWIYTGLILFLGFACFFKLGYADIENWDEARHGINAYEMIKNKNYIANYYNGEVDYWNLKPPISYWFIILGYKIFGYNTIGLRFFSALGYFLMVVIIAIFLKKKCGKLESLISILISMSGYVFFMKHFIRSGDADSIFILFYAIAIISLLKSDDNHIWLYMCGLMFGLCFLTKSWHSFIIAPVVFFYLIFTKGFKRFKWWEIVLFFVSCIIPISIWAIFRYKFDGVKFFELMVEYDLLSRASNGIEGNGRPIYYYFGCLVSNVGMLICVLISIIYLVLKRKNKERISNLSLLSVIAFLSTFVIFSISKTKLSWYIYPCVVPCLLIGAESLSYFFNEIKFNLIKTLSLFLIVCSSLVTVFYPFTIKKEDDLQQFISEVELNENSSIYLETKGNSSWQQSLVLKVELELDGICKDGGWNSFVNEDLSYIIMDLSTFKEYENNDNMKIIYKNNNYVISSLKK